MCLKIKHIMVKDIYVSKKKHLGQLTTYYWNILACYPACKANTRKISPAATVADFFIHTAALHVIIGPV